MSPGANFAVVSAIYDHYDTVKPIVEQMDRTFGYKVPVPVDWVMVTDAVDTAEEAKAAGWRPVLDPQGRFRETTGHDHPNRLAKLPKLYPWNYTRATWSVWVDASFRIMSPTFVGDVLEYARPLAQFKHPWRDCAYAEAEFSDSLPKYEYERMHMLRATQRYRRLGFPEHWGLWATGVIARHHTSEVKDMSRWWGHEINEGSYQDQVSHPWACATAGVRPLDLPGDHITNAWLKYEGSARH